MKKIWLSGSNGQLGKEVQKAFSVSQNFEIIGTTSGEVDFSDLSALENFFNLHQPAFIINCAAYTAVDRAESEIELNDKINHLAVAELSRLCQKNACMLIHISTDFVFDGTVCRPLLEEDLTKPIQEYGRAKLAGEQSIDSGIVLRTSWLYAAEGHNFVRTMMKLGKERTKIQVVNNQFGTPTFAGDLANFIYQLCCKENLQEYKGVYHFSNEGVASWYDFAVSIMEYAELSCMVSPIPDSQFPTAAKRPHFSVLDKQKVKTTFDLVIPHWRTSLKSFIQEIKSHENRN